jgi:hypothetical protein
MSQPRCIHAGRTWLITRRTTRRHFLLRPDADGTTQRLYWYVTAVIAAKFGIKLHAVQVLSTHMHEVLTDVRGALPAFLRERNRLFANALKHHRRWPEEVFQRAPASCVALYGVDAVLKEIGYTIANCVEAGLVHHPAQWPGVGVHVDDIGRRVVKVERPNIYFDPANPNWPKAASIALEMPEIVHHVHGTRARDVLRATVRAAIENARELARKAKRFVSTPIAKLLTVPFTRRAHSSEPVGSRNPTFATAGNPHWVRVAMAERRSFLHLYRRALEALRTGLDKLPFPEGTWRWPKEILTRSVAPTTSGQTQSDGMRERPSHPATDASQAISDDRRERGNVSRSPPTRAGQCQSTNASATDASGAVRSTRSNPTTHRGGDATRASSLARRAKDAAIVPRRGR